ncbi:MAG: hypothetical protein J0L99_10930 [Chitinophagales bacterium]|nr:hypothetical protein [Chitinophagales bacterium]
MDAITKNSYQKFLFDFIRFDILVSCPACSKKAVVKPGNFEFGNLEESDIKVICSHCGYNKKLSDQAAADVHTPHKKADTTRQIVLGDAIDPFFHLPLWLQTDFEKYTFWAYNVEHLDFLQDHIGAKLRERNGQAIYNRSLGSRLPKWMTSKQNRAVLLKKIEALKDK